MGSGGSSSSCAIQWPKPIWKVTVMKSLGSATYLFCLDDVCNSHLDAVHAVRLINDSSCTIEGDRHIVRLDVDDCCEMTYALMDESADKP